MRLFKFILSAFVAVFFYGLPSAKEREINQIWRISSKEFLPPAPIGGKGISMENIKDIVIYRWVVGKRTGVLATAVSATDSGECLALTYRKNQLFIIGASPYWHRCEWSHEIPSFFTNASGSTLILKNRLDISGDSEQLNASAMELWMGDGQSDFCLLESIKDRCVRY